MLKLHDISFLDWEPLALEVAPGEIVCLQGASGSGKSLLLRAVADLIPHQGDAFLDGEACSAMPPTTWRRRVGYLPAETLWWEDFVGAHFLNTPPNESFERLALDAACIEWEVTRLSMGERQRLGLLRLLDREPKALLLDEPTSNLDDVSARAVESLLREYIATHQAPALWVSHDREQAERIGQRIFKMEARRLERV